MASRVAIKVMEALVTPVIWIAEGIKFLARKLRIEPFFITSSILVSLLVAFEIVDLVLGGGPSPLGVGILVIGCLWLIFVAGMVVSEFRSPNGKDGRKSKELDDNS